MGNKKKDLSQCCYPDCFHCPYPDCLVSTMPKADSDKKKPNIRASWEELGIDKEKKSKLREICRDSRYAPVVLQTAYKTCELIGWHIYMSVSQNLSYEGVEWLDGHQIPVARTNFYGYRRMFYSYLDKELKGMGK